MTHETTQDSHAGETPGWTMQALSDHSALVRYDPETVYLLGATPQNFVLKVLKAGETVEEASVCYSPADKSMAIALNVGEMSSKLHLARDGGCMILRYFINNKLVLQEEGPANAGYTAEAKAIATDRQFYERARYLRAFVEKVRTDHSFKEEVSRSINIFANPGTGGPVDYCDWVCKACWNWMYLPHSCIACIYCNGFQIDTGPHSD